MNLTDSSNEELVSLFRLGNNEAFDVLLHRYKDQIWTAISRVINVPEEVKDIFQDLSIHLSIQLKQHYVEDGKFVGWLNRVVENYLCSYCRKKKIKMADLDLEIIKTPQTDYMLSPKDRELKFAELRKSVKELPDDLQRLVEMKIWQRMSLNDIAVKLNMKKSTVAKRLQSAYNKIEQSMIAKGYDDAFI